MSKRKGAGAGEHARGARRPALRPGRTAAVLAVATALVLAGVAAYTLLPGLRHQPARAEAAPSFTLPDTEGRQVSLAALKGKPVALVFFRTFG